MLQASQPINTVILGAVFGWPMIVFLVFSALPPRRAVIVSFLAGWMFLPDVTFFLPGIPDYTKTVATTVGVILGVAVFDLKTVLSYRPTWFDLPMITMCCVCPFASSMTNGLGLYNSASAVFSTTLEWGAPYLLGRVYLRNFEAFRELAVLLFIAGLVYAPLCLFEIRMSPKLNKMVYGFGNVSGGGEYSAELGSWGSRPRVFMGTGLALGTFMTAASLMGVWLWYTGAVRRIGNLPAGPLAAGLVVVAFACKNMGALSLLIFGLAALFSIKYINRPWLIYLLILAAPLYMGFRATGNWSAESMVNLASMVHEQRGRSLQGRLINDSMLAEKALQRPVFGWGGWGRARIYDEHGNDICVTDGLWIITLGDEGLLGLTALTAALLIPATLLARRYPARTWLHPQVAPAAAGAVLVVLYMIDNLFNSMFNPVYVMAAGGLITVVLGRVLVSPAPGRPVARVGRTMQWGIIAYEDQTF